jgi:hypothetical protein
MMEPGLIMGRKATSPSGDRAAEARTSHGDSCPARRQAAPPGVRVVGVQKTRHRDRSLTRQSPLTPTEVGKTFPQVIDDFYHPIPVLERELDAIEMYLGSLIDKMLQRKE